MTETGTSAKRQFTRRLRAVCRTSASVLALSCGLSVALAAGDTWDGTWERTELPGKHLFLTQTGSMVNGHYDWNDASGVLGGNVSGATLTAGFSETRYEGSATLTLAGKAFSGSYTGKNKETGGSIEGPFNGRCVAGACLSNGAPAPSAPPVSPRSTPPPIGKPTLYEAPAPGAAASYQLPKLNKNGRELDGELTFVDSEGNPAQGPEEGAIEAQAERAGIVCYVIGLAGADKQLEEEFNVPVPGDAFGKCVEVVARVLARDDEIKRSRAKGSRARAAARTCRLRARASRNARSMLRVRCTATRTGLRVDIRPRSSKQTLLGALHGRAPRLIIARSAVTPAPTGLRLRELWRAKSQH